MAKILTIGGMVVSAGLAIAFGMDMILGVPFAGGSMMMDVGFLTVSLILGYLSWNAFRDAK